MKKTTNAGIEQNFVENGTKASHRKPMTITNIIPQKNLSPLVVGIGRKPFLGVDLR
jgi:hypothetical protein